MPQCNLYVSPVVNELPPAIANSVSYRFSQIRDLTFYSLDLMSNTNTEMPTANSIKVCAKCLVVSLKESDSEWWIGLMWIDVPLVKYMPFIDVQFIHSLNRMLSTISLLQEMTTWPLLTGAFLDLCDGSFITDRKVHCFSGVHYKECILEYLAPWSAVNRDWSRRL